MNIARLIDLTKGAGEVQRGRRTETRRNAKSTKKVWLLARPSGTVNSEVNFSKGIDQDTSKWSREWWNFFFFEGGLVSVE